MTELEGAGHRAAEQIVQSLDIAGREPLGRGATASGDCASVVHALVRLAVKEMYSPAAVAGTTDL